MKANPILNMPNLQSADSQWIQWHKDMVSAFGKKTANSRFIALWSVLGNSNANTTNLRSYLKEQGVEIQTDLTGKIADIGTGIGDTISSVFKFGLTASYILTGIIGITLLVLLINVAKSPLETVKAIR